MEVQNLIIHKTLSSKTLLGKHLFVTLCLEVIFFFEYVYSDHQCDQKVILTTNGGPHPKLAKSERRSRRNKES